MSVYTVRVVWYVSTRLSVLSVCVCLTGRSPSAAGPATVQMVSTNSSPPMAYPVQVPPGHMMQQVVDGMGTLRHVILSPEPRGIAGMPPYVSSVTRPRQRAVDGRGRSGPFSVVHHRAVHLFSVSSSPGGVPPCAVFPAGPAALIGPVLCHYLRVVQSGRIAAKP